MGISPYAWPGREPRLVGKRGETENEIGLAVKLCLAAKFSSKRQDLAKLFLLEGGEIEQELAKVRSKVEVQTSSSWMRELRGS